MAATTPVLVRLTERVLPTVEMVVPVPLARVRAPVREFKERRPVLLMVN